jgi:nucleoid DNA-binding protein
MLLLTVHLVDFKEDLTMAAKKASAKAKRKSVVKKKPMKAAASKTVAVKKLTSVKDPLTKSGIIKALMDMNGHAKKDVSALLEGLAALIELHVKSRGPGKFTLPGLLKITVVKKAARPARKGINPFTGEEVMFKAKPAHKVVKIKALRALKEMVD